MKLVTKSVKSRNFEQSIKSQQNKYEGSQYAVKLAGGFQISDPIKKVTVKTVPNIAKYDITDSLQIAFPAQVLNSLENEDKIIVSSQSLLDNLKEDSIISFGSFENLYSKYESFINASLGHMFSNTSLFSSNYNSKFDNKTFYELLNSKTMNHENALTGDIHIFDVKRTLDNIEKLNIFGNRTAKLNGQQFVAGDFLFMKNGLSITLKTDLSIQNMYLSLQKYDIDSANRNKSDWNDKFTKTYCGDLLIYLV
jgi:hypothetical protein